MTRAAQIESPAALVDRLFNEAFAPGRAPRSAEYKAGVRALLSERAGGPCLSYPHTLGTAQADAFRAGIEEGQAIWRAHRETTNGGGHGPR